MNKRLSYLAAVLLGLAFTATPALAAEFKSGQAVRVGQSDTVSGDLYAAANDVSVDSNLPGDAFLAGPAVRVNGEVGQSLFVAGSMVNIGANVADDLRVAGSQVMLGGTVQGDVQATGGMVYILPSAVINGDLYIAAGSVTVEGKVLGSVRVASGELILKGEVGKEVYAQADKVTVGPQAKVGGVLYYESMKEATIDQGSSIAGGVEYKKVEKPEGSKEREHKGFGGWAVAWWFGTLLASLVAAFLGWYLFKQRVNEVVTTVLDDFGRQLGWGFVWLVVAPVAGIILLCTLFGIPVACFVFAVYALVIMIAKIIAGVVLGVWLMKLIDKKRGWLVDWKAILLGVAAMCLLMLIPVIGWVACFIFFLAAFGGVVNALKPIVK
jgi:cytoskeletal protein CcmA (bactofilin family)